MHRIFEPQHILFWQLVATAHGLHKQGLYAIWKLKDELHTADLFIYAPRKPVKFYAVPTDFF